MVVVFVIIDITLLTCLMCFTCYITMKAMDLFDAAEGFTSLEDGLARITCPAMVLGVQTDILFPIWQQRELASMLQKAGQNIVIGVFTRFHDYIHLLFKHTVLGAHISCLSRTVS